MRENRRFSMNEVALFTLKDGKSAKEEFFYARAQALALRFEGFESFRQRL